MFKIDLDVTHARENRCTLRPTLEMDGAIRQEETYPTKPAVELLREYGAQADHNAYYGSGSDTLIVSAALLSRRKQPVPVPISESYDDWSLTQLKLECTARKLNVVKNTNKEGRIALLSAYDKNKKAIQKKVQ
ncbi:hypothetical protein PInf_004317 [Phytophthora infestans]|nr:hypothetical protein PInf_004317 [Phytophthora infestans]